MNILLAGLGQMGNIYLKALKKLSVREDEILGHDIDPAKEAAAKEKFPGLGFVREFLHDDGDMYAEACEQQINRADTAIIAVNTPSHHTMALKLMDFGYRYLLIEKPLGINLAAVEEIQKIRRETSSKIFTAFLMNFSPALLHVTEKMQQEGLILTEGSVVWGKNRVGDKRPTPGDLEDESVHGAGILHKLAGVNQKIDSISVSSMLAYPTFADADAQAKAHKLDASFPLKANATSMILERIQTSRAVVRCVIHSSFVYSYQVRRVSAVLSKKDDPSQPVYSVQMDFDVKMATGHIEDQLIMTTLDGNRVEHKAFTCDKIMEQTAAFLATRHGVIDSRLTGFDEALAAVQFSQSVLSSHDSNGQWIMA